MRDCGDGLDRTVRFDSFKERDAAENADEETARYEEKLRERVLAIVSQIDGVGEAHVSVTLDSGIEYVYAKEEKQDTDTRDGASGSTTTRASSEEKLIIVEDENGRKTALLRKTLLPAVRGVVVVCEGGGDPLVVSAVTEAVKTALGVNTSQVCVIKTRRRECGRKSRECIRMKANVILGKKQIVIAALVLILGAARVLKLAVCRRTGRTDRRRGQRERRGGSRVGYGRRGKPD